MTGRNRGLLRSIILLMSIFLISCAGKDSLPSTTGAEQEQSEEAREQERSAETGKAVYAPIAVSKGLMEDEDSENPAGRLQERCGNVSVRIQAGNLIGSGIIYKSDENMVWIATAAHVLDNVQDPVKITFSDGFATATSSIKRAEEQDVAFLLVAREALVVDGTDHGENYRCAPVSQDAYDAVQEGDLVIALGSKSGVGEEAYAGMLLQDYVLLEDFGVYMMVADVVTKPGMSGGGLFDAKGHLIGILCGVSEDDEVAVAPLLSLMALEE